MFHARVQPSQNPAATEHQWVQKDDGWVRSRLGSITTGLRTAGCVRLGGRMSPLTQSCDAVDLWDEASVTSLGHVNQSLRGKTLTRTSSMNVFKAPPRLVWWSAPAGGGLFTVLWISGRSANDGDKVLHQTWKKTFRSLTGSLVGKS